MQAAYAEALHAVGNADPNPAVGAIVVSEAGEILSRGFTHRAGHAHAERHALDQLPGADLSRATLYVTLEPCCHHGRTPPCVDAILDRKIRRVVIAERDFAAEVAGRSVAILEGHGVAVTVLDSAQFGEEGWLTTGPFFFSRQNHRPRITLKWAQTKDGSIAPLSGTSGQISGKIAAYITAGLRSYHKLTLATPGTVRSDKPRLTVRFDGSAPGELTGLTPVFRNLLGCQEMQPPESIQFKPPMQVFLGGTAAGYYDSKAWHQDFRGELQKLLQGILREGFNQVLIEAGPTFSELMIGHGFADAIAVYRSHEKTAQQLWGNRGRGNRLSAELSGDDALPGYRLLEHARFEEDDFLFYARA